MRESAQVELWASINYLGAAYGSTFIFYKFTKRLIFGLCTLFLLCFTPTSPLPEFIVYVESIIYVYSECVCVSYIHIYNRCIK